MIGSRLDAQDVADLADLLRLTPQDAGVRLPWPFLQQLKTLTDSECVSFGALDARQRRHAFLQVHDWDDTELYTAGTEFTDGEDDLFWQYYWDCEPCSYSDRTGDHTSVTQISDFYSVRQWRSHPMYVDLLEPIQHEMLVAIPDGGIDRSLRLLLIRESGPGFTDEDRLVLALLRPHIAEAYRAGERRGAGPSPLTPRQIELLELVRDGATNRQIARRMALSENTVRTHLNHIFERLDVTSRTAAVTKGLSRTS